MVQIFGADSSHEDAHFVIFFPVCYVLFLKSKYSPNTLFSTQVLPTESGREKSSFTPVAYETKEPNDRTTGRQDERNVGNGECCEVPERFF
jgi:hypothetical protein